MRSKTSRISRSSAVHLLLTLVSVLLLQACLDDTVRIGAVLPLTGDDAIYGEALRNGIDLAYQEIAGKPGFEKIELLPIRDSKSDPVLARQHLEELYAAGAMAVIGGVTNETARAMVDVVDETQDKVLLSPSASSPQLTGISRNFYRIWPSDYTAAVKMANFARDREIETIVVVVEPTYGRGSQDVFKTTFEEQGGQVVETIEIPEHTDPGGLAERVATLAPQAVYIAAYATSTGAMISALRGEGFKGSILTTAAFATPSAIALVGETAQGVFLTQIFFELDSEHAHIQKFVQGYKERYESEPDLYAAYGYDAMRVLSAAAAGRPPVPGELHKGLRDISEFPGVTGSIQFNEQGDVQSFPRIYLIGEGLALYDYGEIAERQRREREIRRRELEEKLRQLREGSGKIDG